MRFLVDQSNEMKQPLLGIALLLATAGAHALQADESLTLPAGITPPQATSPATAEQADAVVMGNKPIVDGPSPKVEVPPTASADENLVVGYVSGMYGPIQSGESLSTVSMQISDVTGVHVAQVMWALYESNRKAFDKSINRLRVGAMLQIPPAESMTRISIGQARINIRDAAAERRQKPATESPAQTAPQSDAVSTSPVQTPAAPTPITVLTATPATLPEQTPAEPEERPSVAAEPETPATVRTAPPDPAPTAVEPKESAPPPTQSPESTPPQAAPEATQTLIEPSQSPEGTPQQPAESPAEPVNLMATLSKFKFVILLAAFVLVIVVFLNQSKKRKALRAVELEREREEQSHRRAALADLARGVSRLDHEALSKEGRSCSRRHDHDRASTRE